MSDPLPRDYGKWLHTLGGVMLVVFIVAIVGGLLFPAISDHPVPARRAEARIGAANLVAAQKAYMIEYGHWPDFTGDGLFLDEVRNAQLLRVLRAKDDANNPRKIIFFEAKTAGKGSDAAHPYHGGISPETGAFFDPWGGFYRIVIDSDYDGQIANPYPDDPPIGAGVIVWSLGKDGQQGAPANPRTLKGSDDVVSWQ